MLLTYRAYGRTLATDRVLPELERSNAPADITIAWNARRQIDGNARWTTLWRFSTGEPWVTMTRLNGVHHFRFGRYADVALSDGRIDVSRRGHASDATLRHLVLDQALPLALASQGAFVVHASAVARGRRAIVIAGRAGAGKSTLAALLARQGWRVVADDGAVLDGQPPHVRVIGAYPGLRVFKDSADAAGLDVMASATVAEYSRKVRVVPANGVNGSQSEPLTLVAMYSLRPGGNRVEIDRLTRRDAAVELLAHAYRSDPHDRASVQAQLDRVTMLAADVDVWRVSYPRDLSRAGALASTIAAHASSVE